MAQKRNRPTVSLTLDPDVRERAEAVLEQLPGEASFSRLVDVLLDSFAETVTAVGAIPIGEGGKAMKRAIAYRATASLLDAPTPASEVQ